VHVWQTQRHFSDLFDLFDLFDLPGSFRRNFGPTSAHQSKMYKISQYFSCGKPDENSGS
jgi:hypothetical protein